MSNISFYSDTKCQTQLSGGIVTGASDGDCTQFGISNFGSFAVRSLGNSCVVTVYENDEAYCSSDRREVVTLGQCVTNSTINQFSVDGCSDTSAVAPAVSSASGSGSGSGSSSHTSSAGSSTTQGSASTLTTTATGANGSVSVLTVSVTATAPASSSTPTDSVASSGVSTGAKVGTGIGIALGVVALFAIAIYFILRHKKKQKTPPVSSEEKEIESVSGVGVAPAYSFRDQKGTGGVGMQGVQELSPEGRPLAELPHDRSSRLVEAPGDYVWAAPQEMEAEKGRSELTGSVPGTGMK